MSKGELYLTVCGVLDRAGIQSAASLTARIVAELRSKLADDLPLDPWGDANRLHVELPNLHAAPTGHVWYMAGGGFVGPDELHAMARERLYSAWAVEAALAASRARSKAVREHAQGLTLDRLHDTLDALLDVPGVRVSESTWEVVRNRNGWTP